MLRPEDDQPLETEVDLPEHANQPLEIEKAHDVWYVSEHRELQEPVLVCLVCIAAGQIRS